MMKVDKMLKSGVSGAMILCGVMVSQEAHAALINNGVVALGVNNEGHLNTPYDADPLGIGTLGIRYIPTGNPATEPGCLCEGWGIGDANTGIAGYANVSTDGGAFNMNLVNFTATTSTAVSIVDVASTFRVTHDFHPSPATPFLYEVNVSIQNISASSTDVRYRRVMDWDIYPTPFAEYVTIDPGTAEDLFRTDTNGFNSGNPFLFYSYQSGPVTDAGPADHGALFDFDFGVLAPGSTKEFRIFYGAAATESDANAALVAVGAEAYSFGQPSSPGGYDIGSPNTFIFAFAGVGGTPVFCGNSVVDAGEQCDDGNLSEEDGCDSNCTLTACGNGIVTSGEECDDGNPTDGDGCDADCSLTCPDEDADGACDADDNCVGTYNPEQGDEDADGIGNACDPVCLSIQRGVFGAVADSYISPGEPHNTSAGAYVNLYTGYHSSGQKQSLISFDLSPLPEGATVLSASMQIGVIYSSMPGIINVHRITAPWSEPTVTYASFGNAFDPAILASFAVVPNTNTFQSIDLTDQVQDWSDGTTDNDGILIEESGTNRHSFRSSESGNVGLRPKLDVCYVSP